MHIVLVNQYFPPDEAPTGLMLEAVAHDLADLGHQVTVVCAAGGYANTGTTAPDLSSSREEGNLRIIRLRATGFGRGTFIGKLSDYLSFYLGVAWTLASMRQKPDRIVALTTPPYLSVLARVFSAIRNADHAHWIMDLYPDVMIAHGMIRERSLVAWFLKAMARFGFGGGRCAMVLTLGPDMMERTRPYHSPRTRSEWVPLWGTAEESTNPYEFQRQARGNGNHPVVMMYSGNMGLGHRFSEFLEAAAFSGTDFRWRFNGAGKRRVEIEDFAAKHPGVPIELGPYVSRSELAAHLSSADVHLASLDPSWDGTMVPSKLQGIFAIGRPVLFIGSASCSMGQWIQQSGGGWVVEPGDLTGLRLALEEARDPRIRESKGEAARVFAFWYFNRRFNAGKIANYLSQKGPSGPRSLTSDSNSPAPTHP